MTEQRGYLNGARSELVSARPLAGCSAISAARPPPVARVTIEIRQQPRMVATPARSQQRGMRDAVLETAAMLGGSCQVDDDGEVEVDGGVDEE